MPASGSHRVKVKTLTIGYTSFAITKVIYVLEDDSEPPFFSTVFEINNPMINEDIFLYNDDESDYVSHY